MEHIRSDELSRWEHFYVPLTTLGRVLALEAALHDVNQGIASEVPESEWAQVAATVQGWRERLFATAQRLQSEAEA